MIPFQKTKSDTNQRGEMLLVVSIILMLFLLSTYLFTSKRTVFQVKASMVDRRIKDTRHLVESHIYDKIAHFSRDWRADPVSGVIWDDHTSYKDWSFGDTQVTLTASTQTQCVTINAVARIEYEGKDPLLNRERRMHSLVNFRNDLFRFDWVFNGDQDLANLPIFLKDNTNQDWNRTVYVAGNLDASGVILTLNGFWMINGEFKTSGNLTLANNTRIYCQKRTGGAPGGPGLVNEWGPGSEKVPSLVINGAAWGGTGLDYFRSFSTQIFYATGTTGVDPVLVFSTATRPVGTPLWYDGTQRLTYTGRDGVSTSSHFVGHARAKQVVVVVGSDITVSGSIACPLTLVCLSDNDPASATFSRGGGVTVLRDLKYFNPTTPHQADEEHTLAVVAEKNMVFSNPLGTTQNLNGYFYAGDFVVVADNHNIQLSGTIEGFPGAGPPGDPVFFVRADPFLSVFPPPQFPRRPMIVSWD